MHTFLRPRLQNNFLTFTFLLSSHLCAARISATITPPSERLIHEDPTFPIDVPGSTPIALSDSPPPTPSRNSSFVLVDPFADVGEIKTSSSLFTASAISQGRNASDDIINRHAVIRIFFQDRAQVVCGGTVVSPSFVLTAAHCLTEGDSLKKLPFGVGVNLRQRVFPQSSRGDDYYFAKKLYFRREYTTFLEHDIALIELSSTIPPGKFQKVRLRKKLPRTGDNGRKAFAAGFGLTGPSSSALAKNLQEATLTIRKFKVCHRAVEKNPSIKASFVVCATAPNFPTEGGPSTCGGDSGGALFMRIKGDIRQLGITSFSSASCGVAGGTNWYTKVGKYKDDVLAIANKRSQVGDRWVAYP